MVQGVQAISRFKSRFREPVSPTLHITPPKMELDLPEFHEAWERLRCAGLLIPSRLAVLPDSSLQGLAELAVRDTSLSTEAILEWLAAEKERALPLHQIAQAEHLDYYRLHVTD